MRVEYLADHIHVIPELASFHLEFFGRFNPDMTIDSRMHQLRSRVERDSIPLTLVAFDHEIVVGSACLIDNDMDTHPELSPWVASVIVRPEYRRRTAAGPLHDRQPG